MANRRNVLLGTVGIFSLACPAIVRARQPSVTLDLLFDASGSIFSHGITKPNGEFRTHAQIQRAGHIEALKNPDIATALIAQRTLVRLIAWNSVAWEFGPRIRVEHERDIFSLVSAIERDAPMELRQNTAPTYHDVAVGFALDLPHDSERHIIDVSTDEGVLGREDLCTEVRTRAERSGVTVNVLAVGMSDVQIAEVSDMVKTWEGFLVRADEWSGYHEGIRRKLRQEIAVS
jgi:hypothetical protein